MAQPNPSDQDNKSEFRKIAEHKAKQQLKKKGRKLAKLALKKGAHVAKVAISRAVVVLLQVLKAFLAYIGLPNILLGIGIILGVVFLFFIISIFFGNGEELDADSEKLYDYMEERAYVSVDMSKSEQVPYRVPVQLITAAIQISAANELIESERDAKKLIRKLGNELAPTFEYSSFNEWQEKQVTVCEDGVCNEGPVVKTDNYVDKLTYVDAWNGQTTTTYKAEVTPWVTKETISYRTETYTETEEYIEPGTRETITEKQPIYGQVEVLICNDYCVIETRYGVVDYKIIEVKTNKPATTKTREVEKQRQIEVKTITKTRQQVFSASSNYVEGYSALDQVLNIYSYGFQDKRLVEAYYMGSAGASELPLPPINYTNWLNSVGLGGTGGVGPGFNGTIIPGGGVPPQYMPYYLEAENKYGVDWFVLAALHFTETAFSTHPTMISSVGALGHMQFMPATWVGWHYNIGGGRVSSALDITSLNVISTGRGYGVDGSGDGKADPWDIQDAIHTAANYVSKSGYATDQRKAIFAYNRAEWYVNKVLAKASEFRDAATYNPDSGLPEVTEGTFMQPSLGYVTSDYGTRSGGYHHGVDIGNNGVSTPIVAVAAGTVSKSYFSDSYGNVVFIKHTIDGKTYETVYAHLSNRPVKQGQQVKKGQYIGDMGATGAADGLHLHFEIHNGQWTSNKTNSLNPALFVPLPPVVKQLNS